ncbi:unnamed protein product [Effrenium voratum]|nr:unnamed protein product [Effrenium voratum]
MTDVLDAVDTTPEMMRRLNIPTVFVGADNDPLAPPTRLLQGEVQKLVPDCAILSTSHGSHMAWWQGAPWALHQTWALDTMAELISLLSGHARPETAGTVCRAEAPSCFQML